MKEAFGRAATYFVLYAFQDGLKHYSYSRPSWRITDLLKNPSYKDLFDYALKKHNPIDVMGMRFFDEEIAWRDQHRVYLEAETHFTCCRLAFALEKGELRLSWAERYHEQFRPSHIVGLSKKDEYRGYANRAAYLAAASLVLPSLLDFDINSVRIRDEDVPSSAAFARFCSTVRAIGEALDCPGGSEIKLWTGLEPIPPKLPTIPAKLLGTWTKPSRRSAATTALGNKGRQKPQPKTLHL